MCWTYYIFISPQKIIKGSHRVLNVPLVPGKFVCVDFGYTLKNLAWIWGMALKILAWIWGKSYPSGKVSRWLMQWGTSLTRCNLRATVWLRPTSLLIIQEEKASPTGHTGMPCPSFPKEGLPHVPCHLKTKSTFEALRIDSQKTNTYVHVPYDVRHLSTTLSSW